MNVIDHAQFGFVADATLFLSDSCCQDFIYLLYLFKRDEVSHYMQPGWEEEEPVRNLSPSLSFMEEPSTHFNFSSSFQGGLTKFEDELGCTSEPKHKQQSNFYDYLRYIFSDENMCKNEEQQEQKQNNGFDWIKFCLEFLKSKIVDPLLEQRYVFVSVFCSTILETYSIGIIETKGPIPVAFVKFYSKLFGVVSANLLYNLENPYAHTELLSSKALIHAATKGISKVAFIEYGIDKDNLAMNMFSTGLAGIAPDIIILGSIDREALLDKFEYAFWFEFFKLLAKKSPAKDVFARSVAGAVVKIAAKNM